jgi:PHD/YefM family antitoxin component YafN of YafNO toxin-antitoxin module
MKEPAQFLTNESGERVAVIIPIADYEEIIERLEDLDDIRAYDEAKASGETPVPLEQALAELESERNRK